MFEYGVVVCFVFYRDFKDTFWSGEIVGSGLVGGVVERERERGEKERRAAVATAVRCGAVRWIMKTWRLFGSVRRRVREGRRGCWRR